MGFNAPFARHISNALAARSSLDLDPAPLHSEGPVLPTVHLHDSSIRVQMDAQRAKKEGELIPRKKPEPMGQNSTICTIPTVHHLV